MNPEGINLAKMAVEKRVVENAGRSAMQSLEANRGQRFSENHQQFGNLQATGYALATDEARSGLRRAMGALGRALSRLLTGPRSAERPAQNTRQPAHGRTAAGR